MSLNFDLTFPMSHSLSESHQSSESDASIEPFLKKIGEIAYNVFGYAPVFGTFIGIHHAYKAITAEEQIDGWEIAKIITEIFSFLIIPQIVYAIALRFAFEDEVQTMLNGLPDQFSQPFNENDFSS